MNTYTGSCPYVGMVSFGTLLNVDTPQVNVQFAILEMAGCKPDIVEKMYFNRLIYFVYVEFMRGAAGIYSQADATATRGVFCRHRGELHLSGRRCRIMRFRGHTGGHPKKHFAQVRRMGQGMRRWRGMRKQGRKRKRRRLWKN